MLLKSFYLNRFHPHNGPVHKWLLFQQTIAAQFQQMLNNNVLFQVKCWKTPFWHALSENIDLYSGWTGCNPFRTTTSHAVSSDKSWAVMSRVGSSSLTFYIIEKQRTIFFSFDEIIVPRYFLLTKFSVELRIWDWSWTEASFSKSEREKEIRWASPHWRSNWRSTRGIQRWVPPKYNSKTLRLSRVLLDL